VALANAVLAGDREAARALADRVMELCQEEGGAG
jgi:dihydrodipicolinate synthase/N-acetylneuraminate lyase